MENNWFYMVSRTTILDKDAEDKKMSSIKDRSAQNIKIMYNELSRIRASSLHLV
jgi:hypothetical protein